MYVLHAALLFFCLNLEEEAILLRIWTEHIGSYSFPISYPISFFFFSCNSAFSCLSPLFLTFYYNSEFYLFWNSIKILSMHDANYCDCGLSLGPVFAALGNLPRERRIERANYLTVRNTTWENDMHKLLRGHMEISCPLNIKKCLFIYLASLYRLSTRSQWLRELLTKKLTEKKYFVKCVSVRSLGAEAFQMARVLLINWTQFLALPVRLCSRLNVFLKAHL